MVTLERSLRKVVLVYIWNEANSLCKPYLHIGTSIPAPVRLPSERFVLKMAINLFKFYYKREPSKNGALLFIGKCYQALKNHEKALEYLKKLWDTDPYNAICFREIGTECLSLGRYEEGLQYALKETSQYPNNADSQANLALILLLLKRLPEADEVIERARKIDEKSQFVDGIYKYIKDVKMGNKPFPDKLTPDGRLP